MDLTVEWADALLRSASTDLIGVANWWDRCRAAIETAAAGAETYPQAVSIACRKLQIDVLTEPSSRTITALAEPISARLQEWREICSRDAIYAVALLRIRRSNRKPASDDKKDAS